MPHAVVQRTFLDWRQPLVRAVAGHLAQQHPQMDFADVIVVVSGGRAGRRIMSLLVDEAERRAVAMFPPVIVTPGNLPEKLYHPPCPEAGALARRVAWARALQQHEAQARRLFPRVAAGADLTALYSPAMLMEQCHQELSGGCTSFAAVAAREFGVDGETRAQRWSAAATIHQTYLRELHDMGLCDIQHARNSSIDSGHVATSARVFLAGIAQLNEQLRRMLDCIAGNVVSLVSAPADLADHFDEFGCPNTQAWLDRPLDLDAADVRIVSSASDQASEAFAAIASRGDEISADQITIGAADDSLVTHLESEAENLIDVPVRYGAGKPVAQTRPYHLLAAVADYVESGAFREFARLVRHPDVEDHIRRCVNQQDDIALHDWRTMLDDYACEHLPDRLGDAQRTTDGWRRTPAAHRDERDHRPDLAWLYGCVEDLIAPLRDDADSTATPDEWAPKILGVLSRAYAVRSWDQSDEAQRRVVVACTKLRECLDELHELRAEHARMTSAEAIRAVLSLAATCRIPPPLTGREIEIVGWLELMPDDAEHLIVTGFNDRYVPDSSAAGPFITNDLRRELKLITDDEWFARDAYLLSAMLASRPPGRVTLISGRVSPDGDPLLPSRLLFACDGRKLAARVIGVMDDRNRPPRVPLAYRFTPAQSSRFPTGAVIPPPQRIEPVTSMRVTAFRDYLRSPQGFYLKHVRRLDTIEDAAPRELDPRQCGSLVHSTLKAFADGPASASTSRDQCLDVIIAEFETLALARFGAAAPAALKFQLELIKLRLQWFAEWQADRAREGWRIRFAEWSAEGKPFINVDGKPMYLRGQIDRIDFHEQSKQWAVLDYKLGAKRMPEETHLQSGEWRDLQLPLYRHLAAGIVADNPVKLGYITIAETQAEIGLAEAPWDDAALAGADEAAAAVIRAVRECKFHDEGDDPPTDGAFAFIFNANLVDEEAREQGAEQ